MSFPVSYFTPEGNPIIEAARSQAVFDIAARDRAEGKGNGSLGLSWAIKLLQDNGFSVTLVEKPLEGIVARVQIDTYGTSASEVESTLLSYGSRCDAATERRSVSYGRCVIERNLEEEWGDNYSWKGRLVLHPDIGMMPSSERAKEAINNEKN
jgi:hypothetical protein